jgi:predicted dinucleotide-binding enzyme
MNIGIIGTGNMGRTLGLRWARAGHRVLFGSRDLAKATAVAASIPGLGTQAGDFDAAAAFGDVVLYTVREVFPSTLLRAPQALAGKIVIDCNNRDLGDDRRPGEFSFATPPPTISLTQRLAADAPAARIVKAFSTIPHPVIELDREALAPRRVSVLLCADDGEAKAVVKELVEQLGFIGVDSGRLEHAPLVDGVADFLRLQIGPMGLGLFATMSVAVLNDTQEQETR